jgi:hypothetical protein
MGGAVGESIKLSEANSPPHRFECSAFRVVPRPIIGIIAQRSDFRIRPHQSTPFEIWDTQRTWELSETFIAASHISEHRKGLIGLPLPGLVSVSRACPSMTDMNNVVKGIHTSF